MLKWAFESVRDVGAEKKTLQLLQKFTTCELRCLWIRNYLRNWSVVEGTLGRLVISLHLELNELKNDLPLYRFNNKSMRILFLIGYEQRLECSKKCKYLCKWKMAKIVVFIDKLCMDVIECAQRSSIRWEGNDWFKHGHKQIKIPE